MGEYEDLEAELAALKKANLEREIAKETEKLRVEEEAIEAKEKEALRESVKAEVIKEMEGSSIVDVSTEPTVMMNDFDKYVYEPYYKRFHIEKTEGETFAERYENRLIAARNKIPKNRGGF